MLKKLPLMSLFLVLLGLFLLQGVDAQEQNPTTAPQSKPQVILLQIADAIGPATSAYFEQGVRKAEEMQAELVILKLDTPGGLDTSMRKINQSILNSKVPVAVYVAPEGARAASAGTYILYASHVAAMAPATELGAATPVQLSGPMGKAGPKEKEKEADSKQGKQVEKAPSDDQAMRNKVVNDAKAYIRSLAQKRGRNVEWAEKAVVKADSLTAQEALKLKVIDLIAKDTDDLLNQLHGRELQVLNQNKVLNTQKARVNFIQPTWRMRVLQTISNPNIAYILLMIGMYGLIFELINPGNIIPGVLGGICLLLGLYALHVLPVNYTGLALLFFGIALMVTEAFVPSFGALGIGGAVAFVFGSLMLIDTDQMPGLEISHSLIGSVAAVSALSFVMVLSLAIRARRKKVVTGAEQMLGAVGEALEDFSQSGKVFICSEIWDADTDQPLKEGDKIKVLQRQGLRLKVAPFQNE